MKVLVLSQDVPPNIGGIATHVKELTAGLVKAGNKVEIVSYCHNANIFSSTLVREKMGNVDVYKLPITMIPFLRRLEVRVKIIPIINNIYKNGEFDLLHWHNLGLDSVVASYLCKMPRVFTNHSSTFLNMVKNKQGKALAKQIGFADAIISPSMELKNETDNIGYPAAKSYYIPNGVDIEKFSLNPKRRIIKRKEMAINGSTFVILCPRRLVIKNGVRYAVEAMKYLKDKNVKLYIAGDVPANDSGEEKKEIDAIITKNNIGKAVVFLGNITNEHMPNIIDAADAVVIPSLIEATSIAALEAMAMSKPVIASNVGGLPELISDKTDGLLTIPGDSRSIAEAILLLYNERELGAKLGNKARDKVCTDYTWDMIARKTLQVYRSAL